MGITEIALIITAMLSPCPNHPLLKNDGAIKSISDDIKKASDEFNIDPVTLTVWSFCESSFRKTSVGKIGETGYMQTHGTAAMLCKKNGIDSKSIRCGAYLLDYGRKECGDLGGAKNMYASGSCSGTPMSRRIINRRDRMVKKWKKWITQQR